MVVTTPRMLLRQMTGADLEWLARMHGDRRVMRNIDDGEPVPRAQVAARTLPTILREYDELPPGLGHFAAVDRATGRPLGWLSLRPPSNVGLGPPPSVGLRPQFGTALWPADGVAPGADVAELGYRLLPEVWGLGYATEGARALIGHGFTQLDLARVVATTMTLNLASRRVLEKAGLWLVRTFLAAWPGYIEGAEHGDVEYAVDRAAWRAGSLPAEFA
jgi:RimJ/RimL family protein N-acetyltransferase